MAEHFIKEASDRWDDSVDAVRHRYLPPEEGSCFRLIDFCISQL